MNDYGNDYLSMSQTFTSSFMGNDPFNLPYKRSIDFETCDKVNKIDEERKFKEIVEERATEEKKLIKELYVKTMKEYEEMNSYDKTILSRRIREQIICDIISNIKVLEEKITEMEKGKDQYDMIIEKNICEEVKKKVYEMFQGCIMYEMTHWWNDSKTNGEITTLMAQTKLIDEMEIL